MVCDAMRSEAEAILPEQVQGAILASFHTGFIRVDVAAHNFRSCG